MELQSDLIRMAVVGAIDRPLSEGLADGPAEGGGVGGEAVVGIFEGLYPVEGGVVGFKDGPLEGSFGEEGVGFREGPFEGVLVGFREGPFEEMVVGFREGPFEGVVVGLREGPFEEMVVGFKEGSLEGVVLGFRIERAVVGFREGPLRKDPGETMTFDATAVSLAAVGVIEDRFFPWVATAALPSSRKFKNIDDFDVFN